MRCEGIRFLTGTGRMAALSPGKCPGNPDQLLECGVIISQLENTRHEGHEKFSRTDERL